MGVAVVNGGTPTVDSLLVTWPENEQEAFRNFMRWVALEKPETWGALVAQFTATLPGRSESDLRQVFEAFKQDAGAMPILRLMPK